MLQELTFIFVITFFVRIYSSIAGGGRLALLPMLTVMVGLPPSAALATMKCGGISSASSIMKFHKDGKVRWDVWRKLVIFMVTGSVIGSILVVNIDQDIFRKLLSSSMFVWILILPILKKKIKQKEFHDKDQRISFLVRIFVGFVGMIGALFGFKGIFLRYYLASKGMTFLQATATNKAIGFIGKVISIIIFGFGGLIDWPIAATMFVAGALGAWIGTSLSIKIGSKWVERIFTTAVLASVVMMFLQR